MGIQSHRGTNWEHTVLCVSKSLQFWPELSFIKRCVEGERAQVGLRQSLISSEHQRAKNCGSPLGVQILGGFGDLEKWWHRSLLLRQCALKKKKKKNQPFYFRKLERFTKVENRMVSSSSKTYDSSTLPLKKKFFFFCWYILRPLYITSLVKTSVCSPNGLYISIHIYKTTMPLS